MNQTPLVKPTQEEYCRLLSTTVKTTYSAISRVYCKILDKDIIFNAKGFHHLLYKPDGTPRNTAERIHKLTLVPLAIPVIRNATGVYKEKDIEMPKSRKKNAKRVKGKQYALIATVGRKNPVEVRVIILEIENSKYPIFWSIMKH